MKYTCHQCSAEFEKDNRGKVPDVQRCSPCRKQHDSERITKWRIEHRARTRELARNRYAKNRGHYTAKNRIYHAKNKKKMNEKSARYKHAHLDRQRALGRAWQAANIIKAYDRNAARRAMSKKASPTWANAFFIEEAYRLAALRTKVLGYSWHVDHIVPLKHPLVCGLHAHTNIRVIPGVENSRKGNRHWPDMPREIG